MGPTPAGTTSFMGQIGLSHGAAAIDPALGAWLAGVGLAVDRVAPEAFAARDSVRILCAAERPYATHRDLILTIRDGAPSFQRSARGMPAEIGFGFDDMPFGHALVAELVRPAGRPACGEPESAALLALATRIAARDAAVLIGGETGTGKEGLARFIHDQSPRAAGPFVAVNCAALPETMLEAMLFGHQKGAFTGAGAAAEGLFRAAEGGTLFLDEVAELPLPLQAKLLRAIQEREVLPIGATKPIAVDIRIVAAANRDLAAEVAEGRFRADLYWRLNVMPLTLKPLAARRLDVRAIAAALMLRHLDSTEEFPWPTAAVLDRLMGHSWPGNVRELDNVLQRAMLLRAGARLDADDLSIEAAARPAPVAVEAPAIPANTNAPVRLADAARSSEAQAIEDALVATGGHRVRAAARLGISERTLRYRLASLRQAA